MIERVEVLQDGASTIYGSDAIAGVVNIITKKNQQGFAASAQVGSYLDYDDGWTQNYQLSWGNGTRADADRRRRQLCESRRRSLRRPGDFGFPQPLFHQLLARWPVRASR